MPKRRPAGIELEVSGLAMGLVPMPVEGGCPMDGVSVASPVNPQRSRQQGLGSGSGLDMLLRHMQEMGRAQTQLEEALDKLNGHYETRVLMQAIQDQRFRCERLEERLNDLTELHQNKVLNLKQELARVEEKITNQSNERGRDVQEAQEACQTHICKKLISVLLHGISTVTTPLLETRCRTLGSLILLGLVGLAWRNWELQELYTSTSN